MELVGRPATILGFQCEQRCDSRFSLRVICDESQTLFVASFHFFQDIGHKKKLYEKEEENGEVKRTTKKSYVLWSMIEKQNGNENA